MNERLGTFLKELMRRRGRLPSQLAADLGVSHTSVSRWLSGKERPSFESCLKLAAYAAVPLERVLSIVGHLLPLVDTGLAKWPDFREYAKRKYPRRFSSIMVGLISFALTFTIIYSYIGFFIFACSYCTT